jgi:hypothetical protein
MTITLTREEAQQVLDLMTRYRTETPLGHQPHMISHKADEAIETLRARLSAPKPEPVAWNIKHNRPPLSSDNPHEVVAVIKREWQGLTDEEIEDGFMANICCDDLVVYEHVASAIEAKLKEKNHE